MFNVSFKVSDTKLADTLTRLQTIAKAVEVSHIGSGDQDSTSESSSIPAAKPRRYRRRPSGGQQTDSQRATAILRRVGNEPFKISHLLAKCGAEGISAPSVYRSLRLAQDAGFVVKLAPGSYQLKAA